MRTPIRSPLFAATTLTFILLSSSLHLAVAQRLEWKLRTVPSDPYANICREGAAPGLLSSQIFTRLVARVTMCNIRPPFLDPRAGTGVEGAAASLILKKIYVTHGYRGFESLLNSAYTISSPSWTHGGIALPDATVPRSEMGGGTALRKHYAIGGRNRFTFTIMNDNEEFNPFSPTWTTRTPMNMARAGLGVASYNNKIYAIGGRTGLSFGAGPVLDNNERYDPPPTDSWTPRAALLTAVSDNQATVAYKGKIYVCGGVTSSGSVVDLLQIYDIATDHWIYGKPMPTPRAAAMAGVCDGKIVVFGGYNGSTNLVVTEIYNPVTNTWGKGPNMFQPVSEMAQGVTYNANSIFSIGTGIYGASGTVVQELCCKWTVVSDFDGDRWTDVAVWHPADGNWHIIQSSTGSMTVRDWGRGSFGDIPVPGDYDDDGITDLAVFRPSDGNWYVLQSSDGQALIQSWGQSGDIPVPGYYDDDKKTDLAVFRPSDSNWYVLQSTGGTLIQSWGANGDKPVVGDFDADGQTDFTVFRPSDSNWYVLQTTGGLLVQSWGLSTDKLVPSDYDGDRQTDFAVFRPSDNRWYILKSSDGITVRNWGLSTDVPVPGDYDGDEKADIAVFRPSEGMWYILRSNGYGTTFTQLLGASGDVPLPSTYLPQ